MLNIVYQVTSKDHTKKVRRCHSCNEKPVHAKLEQQEVYIPCPDEDVGELESDTFSKKIHLPETSKTMSDDRQSAQDNACKTSNQFTIVNRILDERKRKWILNAFLNLYL